MQINYDIIIISGIDLKPKFDKIILLVPKQNYRIPRDIGPPKIGCEAKKSREAYIFRNFKFKSLNNHFKNLLRDNELEKGGPIFWVSQNFWPKKIGRAYIPRNTVILFLNKIIWFYQIWASNQSQILWWHNNLFET